MRQSQLFYKTLKETPKEAKIISHQLLIRGGFINQLASGIYSFLPLGWRVHQKIGNIIREEMERIGAQEVSLPALQPKEIWEETNRWNQMEPPLFKLKDLHKKSFALGPTHEEVITKLAQTRIQSYRDLPISLYQIQTKFRNELRPTGGLLRTREFIMKDLYSFHSSEKDFEDFFERVIESYFQIFKRCNLNTIKSQASGGTFTETRAKTFEFQIPSEAGEDRVIFCRNCKLAINLEIAKLKTSDPCPKCKSELEKINTIEVGHVFSLGTKFSKPLNLYFRDEKGFKKPVIMGCYGVGIGRLMATIVEVHHDEKGIIWPKEVTPFQVHLIQIENTREVKKLAEKLYQDLQKKNIDVLYDDRIDKSAGEKFIDCDLIGIPIRMVVSERTISKNSAEVKERSKKKTKLIKLANLSKFLVNLS
jgi:prolyl-tRNA synthetase